MDILQDLKPHKTALAALAVVLATVVLWASCTSGPVADARFPTTLMSHGIPGDRFVEISAAHQLCGIWRRGRTDPQWAAKLVQVQSNLAGQRLSVEQFTQFVADTESAFCPDVTPSA